MKNILKQIKQIFVDNKEYFIRCTIMTLIAGLILGISISLVVPASAAGDPTESDQIVIPAGTYTWNINHLTPHIDSSVLISLPFTLPPLNCSLNGVDGVLTVGEFNIIAGSWNADNEVSAFGYYDSFTLDSPVPVYFNGNEVASVVLLSINTYGQWSTYVQFGGSSDIVPITSIVSSDDASSYGQTIIVTEDTSVNADYASWFFDNTNGVDIDPDPEYTISAGWYLWQEELLGEFLPHTLTFNYRTFQRVGASGIPYYSYWSTMQFDNYVENESYFSRLYYSSISNGRVLVYDDINGGWVDETYRRFYISSPLTLSAEDYFIFNAYTEYYGDIPPSFSGETVPNVPDPDSNIFTNIIGGVLDALDAFTIFGGFSLLDLLTTLLGGMALVWILKLLAGG